MSNVVWSLFDLARTVPDGGAAHWAEAVALLETMEARGVLRAGNASMLDTARKRLAAAQAGAD
jgi:hypothetical protein